MAKKRHGVQRQMHLTFERRGPKYVSLFVWGRYRHKDVHTQKEAASLAAEVKRAGGTVRFKNPTRTHEGRVLRTEHHTRRESSALMLLRKKEKHQHKRRTRRVGRLTYQTAEYVLAHGPLGRRTKRTTKKRTTSTKRRGGGFKGDVWDWIGNTFG